MSVLAMEINDAGIGIARDGKLVLESPGYALADDGRLLLGAQAAGRMFLLPSQSYDRFWDQLSTEVLPRPAPQAKTPADLVYRHIAHLWEQAGADVSSVILCVPGCYTNPQLELLLGITQELGIPIQGLVDSAVAAARPGTGYASLWHLDVHLHRVILTGLKSNGRLTRDEIHLSRETGLATLGNAWVMAIASQFVSLTRFDPLDTAATEQALHDHLPHVMETMQRAASTELSIEHGNQRYTATLSRETRLAAVAHPYPRIAEMLVAHTTQGRALVQISHRLGQFPGLAETLGARANADTLLLEPGASALGALARADRLVNKSGQFSLVTELPNEGPEVEQVAPRADRTITPTHLLFRGLAYAVGPEPLLLGREQADIQFPPETPGVSRRHCSVMLSQGEMVVEDHSTYGTFVNGEQISGTRVLRVGDRLRIGASGDELQAIAVAAP